MEKNLCMTGRYMSMAVRTERIFRLKRNVKGSSVRPAPAPAVDLRQLADQRHIPPDRWVSQYSEPTFFSQDLRFAINEENQIF
jgi:hypothetical protein